MILLDNVAIDVDIGISVVLVVVLDVLVLGLFTISGFCPKANRAAP